MVRWADHVVSTETPGQKTVCTMTPRKAEDEMERRSERRSEGNQRKFDNMGDAGLKNVTDDANL